MTENEAIRDLDIIRFNPHWDELVNEEYWQELMEMAIKALEEVQKYRAIGTPEECRAAVEKQTAKKPDYEGDGYSDGQLVYDTWICPSCGKHYEVDYESYDYCPSCGQKIRLE